MAVNPSTTIRVADMAALAGIANGKSTLPQYINSGNAYNFFNPVKVLTRGMNYKLRDIIGITSNGSGFGFSAEVMAIDAAGGITGIRVLNAGNIDPNLDPQPGNPLGVTGGSGVGAQFYAGIQNTPVDENELAYRPYSFDDPDMRAGNIMGTYLLSGGTGFRVGDTPGALVAGQNYVVTVTGVDANGTITTYTDNISVVSPFLFSPVPQTLAVAGGHGTGAVMGALFTMLPPADWLTELNRLRTNLITIAFPPNDVALRVSGPWPLNAGAIFNGFYLNPGGGFSAPTLPNLRDLSFYYADTGQQESVVLDCGVEGTSYDPAAYGEYEATAVSCQIKVCGPGTVHLKGSFSFLVQMRPGGTTNGSASSDFPITFTTYGLSDNFYEFFANIDADVAPGVYNFSASVSDGNVFYFAGVNVISFDTDPPNNVFSTNGMRVTLSPGLTNSVETPGIHNAKRILKIAIPDAFIGATPFGIQTFQAFNGVTIGWLDLAGTLLTASTDGFLTAITEPVSSLNPATPAVMPWNLRRSEVAAAGLPAYQYNPMIGLPEFSLGPYAKIFQIGSYDISQPLEFQSEPQSWMASRYFNAGDKIVDSNFNVQQAMSGGQTGASQPTWGTAVGGAIQETFVTGNNVAANGVLWQLVSIPTKPVIPVKHRQSATPRYPVYWQNETILELKPPGSNYDLEKTIWGCSSQWKEHPTGGGGGAHDAGWQQDNLAIGWWIYSVAINRLGQADNSGGVSFPKSGTVAVTIGCIRNGSFVAFGTWNTGQTIQVLWPIFTSDALVYQCSERVDVQAVAISTGGNGVSVGPTIASPICAAFYNDTEALLNLIT